MPVRGQMWTDGGRQSVMRRTIAAASTPNASIAHAEAYMTPNAMSNAANLGRPSEQRRGRRQRAWIALSQLWKIEAAGSDTH